MDFHHNTHYHPGPAFRQNEYQGYLAVPPLGEIASNVCFEIS